MLRFTRQSAETIDQYKTSLVQNADFLAAWANVVIAREDVAAAKELLAVGDLAITALRESQPALVVNVLAKLRRPNRF